MFTPSPLPCLSSSLVTLPVYSSGGSLNKVMELFRDVHTFEVTIAGLPLDDPFLQFATNGGMQGSAVGSLRGIEAYNAALDGGAANGYGFTRRAVKDSEYIAEDGEKSLPRSVTHVCGSYPVHTYTNGQVMVVIDFGRTIQYAGLYYPYVLVELSNGMSNNGSGTIVQGTVDFAGLGPILIYGFGLGFAFGSIKVGERYSDIAMSTYTAAAKQPVIFRAIQGKKFSGFKDISEVFIGGVKAPFTSTDTSLTLTVPEGAISDYVVFVGKNNRFNSPDILRISG